MKVEIYCDAANEFRFRMIADNGNILAVSSEGYENKTDCKKSFASIVNYLCSMKYEIVDLTNQSSLFNGD